MLDVRGGLRRVKSSMFQLGLREELCSSARGTPGWAGRPAGLSYSLHMRSHIPYRLPCLTLPAHASLPRLPFAIRRRRPARLRRGRPAGRRPRCRRPAAGRGRRRLRQRRGAPSGRGGHALAGPHHRPGLRGHAHPLPADRHHRRPLRRAAALARELHLPGREPLRRAGPCGRGGGGLLRRAAAQRRHHLPDLRDLASGRRCRPSSRRRSAAACA